MEDWLIAFVVAACIVFVIVLTVYASLRIFIAF